MSALYIKRIGNTKVFNKDNNIVETTEFQDSYFCGIKVKELEIHIVHEYPVEDDTSKVGFKK